MVPAAGERRAGAGVPVRAAGRGARRGGRRRAAPAQAPRQAARRARAARRHLGAPAR